MISKVIEITTIEELENINQIYLDKLFIIDFSASWCPPCQMIKPIFAELSNQYTNCVFLKVDIDKSSELKDFFRPKLLPTFFLMKNGNIFYKWTGANQDTLLPPTTASATSPSPTRPIRRSLLRAGTAFARTTTAQAASR